MTSARDLNEGIIHSQWQVLMPDQAFPAYSLENVPGRLCQEFYSRSRHCNVSIGGQTFHCAWTYKGHLSESYVELECIDHSVFISIEKHISPGPLSERSWWEYDEKSRWLAWSLEHETLVSLLQSQLGSRLQPVGQVRDLNVPASMVNLRWHFRNENHDFSGTMLIGAFSLERLLTNNTWIVNPAASLRKALGISLSVEIPIGDLLAVELHDTGVGDLFMVDQSTTATVQSFIRLPRANIFWMATTQAQHLTVSSPPIQHRFWKHPMSNDQNVLSVDPEPSDLSRSKLLSVEQLRVLLTLQLTEFEVSFGELENLQPGYVISLPTSASAMRPTLLVNGQPIGRGEMVTLGSQLGIRVTEWNHNGL